MEEPLEILYVTHYFPPEVNAPALRVSELARCWVQDGHRVTVLTGFPNHPTGRIPPAYRGEWLRTEDYGSVKLVRTWVYAAANKGIFKRTLNYLSFMLSAVVLGGWRCGRPSVVIGTSPHMFVAVAAWVLSLWKRAYFIFEVRDVWPEELRAVGAVHNRWILRVLEALEMFLYRRADRIVAVAQGTIELLVERGVEREKLVLIPNGVNLDQWPQIHREDARSRLELNRAFVVSYIGTHGMAQGLDTILDAAEKLRDLPNLRILMVGDGADRERLEAQACARQLTHVRFYGQVPHSRVADFYAASDVCLVPLRRADLFSRNIPSKVYEIMASARPLIIGTEGESRDVVQRAGCGLSVAPEDGAAFAVALRRLQAQPELAATMGAQGRRYVEAHHNRGDLAKQYIGMLRDVVDRRTRCVKSSLPFDAGSGS